VASIISHNPKKTFAIARDLGAKLVRGDVIALVGELGAGKTHFVKGLAAGAGYTGDVTSPTFTLIHEYRGGRLPVYHFDFYRLESEEEAARLDLESYLDGDGVCVIEWPDKFPALLPPHTRWFDLRFAPGDKREIEEREGAG
jgi:tRNA threonylcarbamoyladenosine biosynthesis protein TsaE